MSLLVLANVGVVTFSLSVVFGVFIILRVVVFGITVFSVSLVILVIGRVSRSIRGGVGISCSGCGSGRRSSGSAGPSSNGRDGGGSGGRNRGGNSGTSSGTSSGCGGNILASVRGGIRGGISRSAAIVLNSLIGVLNVENRLVDLGKGSIDITLVILSALLIDRPLHLVNNGANDITTVLETDSHATRVSLSSKESQEVNRVRLSQAKTVLIAICIDVVRVHAITALLLCHVQARSHDRSNAGGLDVEPLLAWPVIEVAAEICGGELADIGPPVFVRTSGEVAYDLAALGLEGGDRGCGVVEQVDVPDVSVGGGVLDCIDQLNLPFDTSGRLPNGSVGATLQDLLLRMSSSKLSPDIRPNGEKEEAKNTGHQDLSLGHESLPARILGSVHDVDKNG